MSPELIQVLCLFLTAFLSHETGRLGLIGKFLSALVRTAPHGPNAIPLPNSVPAIAANHPLAIALEQAAEAGAQAALKDLIAKWQQPKAA